MVGMFSEEENLHSTLDPNIENYIKKQYTESELVDSSMVNKTKQNPLIYEIPVEICVQ